jgi:NAD(P)-dependent dehydrogenase (short-subunit alcohol dehydrogenase family)
MRVIVFGGTRGLGLATALSLAADGASIMVASRDVEAVNQAEAQLRACHRGRVPIGERCDVSSVADVRRVVSRAVEDWGGIDGVVNCAGVLGPAGPTHEVDWDAWQAAVEINLFGTAHISRAVVPHLKAAGRGKLIHLSGGGATRALQGLSGYCASKAGVVRLVEVLAEELCGTNIDVNAVAPGPLDTRMLDETLTSGPESVGQEYYDKVRRFKEAGGTPIDIPVALIRFLLSPASDGVTGRLISAIWDPWQDEAAFRAALDRPEMFMLRRVDL